MLRVRVPQLGDGAAASDVTVTGTATLAAFVSSAALAVTVAVTGAPSLAAVTSSGAAAVTVSATGTPSLDAVTSSGAAAVTVALSGTPSLADFASAGDIIGPDPDFSGSATLEVFASSGLLRGETEDTGARGGDDAIYEHDWPERDRRNRAIDETIESVLRPKQPAPVKAFVQEVRETAAQERATIQDAVPSATMDRLRALAESAQAHRRAMDDDDEDVFLMMGV